MSSFIIPIYIYIQVYSLTLFLVTFIIEMKPWVNYMIQSRFTSMFYCLFQRYQQYLSVHQSLRCVLVVATVAFLLCAQASLPPVAGVSRIVQVSLLRCLMAHPAIHSVFDISCLSVNVDTAVEKQLTELRRQEALFKSVNRKIELLVSVFDVERKKQEQLIEQAEKVGDSARVMSLQRFLNDMEDRLYSKRNDLREKARKLQKKLDHAKYLSRFSDRHYVAELVKKIEAGTWSSVLGEVISAIDSVADRSGATLVFNADLPSVDRLKRISLPAKNPYTGVINGDSPGEALVEWVEARAHFMDYYLPPMKRPLFIRGVPDITGEVIGYLRRRDTQ